MMKARKICINKDERFLIALMYRLQESGILTKTYALLTWNEEKNDFGIFPLDTIVPKGKRMKTLVGISDDRRWGLFRVDGYKGMNGEFLFKYAFVNFDSKYPTNFSPLAVIDDCYGEENYWENTSFFVHPLYGQCLLYTASDRNAKKKKTYFYKMSDIQAEIDRNSAILSQKEQTEW